MQDPTNECSVHSCVQPSRRLPSAVSSSPKSSSMFVNYKAAWNRCNSSSSSKLARHRQQLRMRVRTILISVRYTHTHARRGVSDSPFRPTYCSAGGNSGTASQGARRLDSTSCNSQRCTAEHKEGGTTCRAGRRWKGGSSSHRCCCCCCCPSLGILHGDHEQW